MTDQTPTKPTFQTTDVKANQAIENGQGIGARELAAQRQAGESDSETETPDANSDDSLQVMAGKVEAAQAEVGDIDTLDRNVSVQGNEQEARKIGMAPN